MINLLIMRKAEEKYNELRERVERVCGRKMLTTRDFHYLSEQIYLLTHQTVSDPTLRRIWGYQDNGRFTPRPHTLNILAIYVGYNSWADFYNSTLQSETSSSDFISSKHLMVNDLQCGDRIRLIWRPDRCVVATFEGSDLFVINEVANSKLRPGDRFCCRTFIQNEPLYFERLIRDDMAPMSYVCGQDGGVQYEILHSEANGGVSHCNSEH